MLMKQFLATENLAKILLEALDHYFGNVFITDGKGQILYFNASSSESMGCSMEELLSQTSYDLENNKVVSESVSLLVIKTKKKQMRLITYPKTGIVSAVACVPIFDDNGNLVMTVAYSQIEEKLDEFIHTMDMERRLAKQALSYMEANLIGKFPIIANCQTTKDTFAYARTVAASDIPIILYGESGTGKEVLAHYIHNNSNRTDGAFIPINCSAVPRELMEAEFFGYVRGAFTGANNEGRAGVFEMADQGTLFLDELGDFPLALQPKLLRVLETGKFSRLGSAKTQSVNVRIVAATNHNLEKMVAEGKFRKDLYYRLNVVPITLAPLRERPEDIMALSRMFLDRYNKKYHKTKYIPEETMQIFLNYNWPGNIREMRNVMERLVLTASEEYIEVQENFINGGVHVSETPVTLNMTHRYEGTLKEQMRQFEKERIQAIVKECSGDINAAAKRLGISRSSLYQKLADG